MSDGTYGTKTALLPPSYNTYTDGTNDIHPPQQQQQQQQRQQQQHNTLTSANNTANTTIHVGTNLLDEPSNSRSSSTTKTESSIVLSDTDHHAPTNPFINFYLAQMVIYLLLSVLSIISVINSTMVYDTGSTFDGVLWIFMVTIQWGVAPLFFIITTAIYFAGLCCGGPRRPYVRDTLLTPAQANKRLRLHQLKFWFELVICAFFFACSIVMTARCITGDLGYNYYYGARQLAIGSASCLLITMAYVLLGGVEYNLVYWAKRRVEFLQKCDNEIERTY